MGQPLYNGETLRALEVEAARGLPPGTLMQRAGAAAARRIAQRAGAPPRSIVVLCGPGNNGGDGYVCARELARRGFAVTCVALAPPVTDDARNVASAWQRSGGTVTAALEPSARFDVVVDAMFGIGLKRPLDGAFAAACDWMSAQRDALRVALDVPSGLDADKGSWVGGRAGVLADVTVTFMGGKPGLCTGAGCDAAGAVIVEEIGVAPARSSVQVNDATGFATLCKPRARDSHKGTFGNVGVLGGGRGMVGAALLAGRAALRIGAGRVFVECLGSPDLHVDPFHPELMFRRLGSISGMNVVVAGCGLGNDDAARAAIAATLAQPWPLVLDADALNLLATDVSLREAVKARTHPTALTPHPLEAARLLGVSAQAIQNDRIDSARRLAATMGSVVVLKGAGSVVAHQDGRVWINPTGGPALATPGSGDVLAGLIGGLAAQAPEMLDAVLAAVWLHGAAADRHGADIGLVAGDIAPLAAVALAALRGESR